MSSGHIAQRCSFATSNSYPLSSLSQCLIIRFSGRIEVPTLELLIHINGSMFKRHAILEKGGSMRGSEVTVFGIPFVPADYDSSFLH